MKVRANDIIGSGELEIYFGSSTSPSPFGLEFVREPLEEFPQYECSFNMSKSEAKKLAMFILENL